MKVIKSHYIIYPDNHPLHLIEYHSLSLLVRSELTDNSLTFSVRREDEEEKKDAPSFNADRGTVMLLRACHLTSCDDTPFLQVIDIRTSTSIFFSFSPSEWHRQQQERTRNKEEKECNS